MWALVEQGEFTGFLAAHTVTTLHYLLNKHLSRSQSNLTLTKLLQVFAVAAVDQAVILKALALSWTNCEDAVQMTAALNVKIDYLITRNPRDFKDPLVKVLQPAELVALFPLPGE